MNLKHYTDEELALAAQKGGFGCEEEGALAARYWGPSASLDLTRVLAAAFPIAGVDMDDRQSTATEGLIKAIRTFDPGRGTKFKTWAKGIIRRALTDLWRSVHQVSEVPRAALRSIDAAMGSDGDEVSLADLIADDYDFRTDVDRRDRLARAWNAAKDAQWLEITDAVEGDGTEDGERLVRALVGFSRQVLPKDDADALAKMIEYRPPQDGLFTDLDPRGDDASWALLKDMFGIYVDTQRQIVQDMAEGYEYKDIATRLTFAMNQHRNGVLRFRADLVGEIARGLKLWAEDTEAGTALAA